MQFEIKLNILASSTFVKGDLTLFWNIQEDDSMSLYGVQEIVYREV